MHDLVPDVELDLACEDEERVAVPLVEVGLNAASGLHLELDQRELRTGHLDHARSELLALARRQSDRSIRHGSADRFPGHHAGNLAGEPHGDHRRRIGTAVGRRLVLVEVGLASPHVVAEAAGRHVQVEEARALRAVVVEAVDDVGREEDEGLCRTTEAGRSGRRRSARPRRRGTRRHGCDGRAAAHHAHRGRSGTPSP